MNDPQRIILDYGAATRSARWSRRLIYHNNAFVIKCALLVFALVKLVIGTYFLWLSVRARGDYHAEIARRTLEQNFMEGPADSIREMLYVFPIIMFSIQCLGDLIELACVAAFLTTKGVLLRTRWFYIVVQVILMFLVAIWITVALSRPDLYHLGLIFVLLCLLHICTGIFIVFIKNEPRQSSASEVIVEPIVS